MRSGSQWPTRDPVSCLKISPCYSRSTGVRLAPDEKREWVSACLLSRPWLNAKADESKLRAHPAAVRNFTSFCRLSVDKISTFPSGKSRIGQPHDVHQIFFENSAGGLAKGLQ